MSLMSMTGFARAQGHAEELSWVWELKSVNGKSLEMRVRVPGGYEALELPLRATLSRRLARGAVNATLALIHRPAGSMLRVNRPALDTLIALARELAKEVVIDPPRLDGLLALKGVLESGDEGDEVEQALRHQNAILTSAESALDALIAMRAQAGVRLGAVLAARLDEIASLVEAAERNEAAQPASQKARLKALVNALLEASPALPEERLTQEVALLVAKADIREELDRLAAHLAAARGLLAEGGAIGRRLDFLCQEFHREANTLCAKSQDLALTRIGLGLKAEIERLREQVQNIE